MVDTVHFGVKMICIHGSYGIDYRTVKKSILKNLYMV